MRFIFPILILVFLLTQPCSVASSSSSSPKKSTASKTTTSTTKKADPFPRAAASYLIQVNGKTLWAHNPDRKLPIASITKIMTAIIVLERCQLDEIVTVSDSVKTETGTRLWLKPGEKFRVRDLLAAALINSACDACVALADHVAGSQSKFVEMMNTRATELGLKNTHFQNAAGHDHTENYSTANEISILAKKALKNKFFAEMVSTDRKKITTINGKRTFQLKNTNDMLGTFEGTKGVKTGFTSQAGKCLVSLASRKGIHVMLVLLNSPQRWQKADEMMKKAFTVNKVEVASR
jgi:serine-type D-Ala-D-Ala carboxypeptidase (penicillin-binding protein 5/6)